MSQMMEPRSRDRRIAFACGERRAIIQQPLRAQTAHKMHLCELNLVLSFHILSFICVNF